MAKSPNLREKQMEDHKSRSRRRLHLGDGSGWRRWRRARKSRLPQTNWQQDILKWEPSIKSACGGERRASVSPPSPSLRHSAPFGWKSMWDRLRGGRKPVWSSTNKHEGPTAKWRSQQISSHSLCFRAGGTWVKESDVVLSSICSEETLRPTLLLALISFELSKVFLELVITLPWQDKDKVNIGGTVPGNSQKLCWIHSPSVF